MRIRIVTTCVLEPGIVGVPGQELTVPFEIAKGLEAAGKAVCLDAVLPIEIQEREPVIEHREPTTKKQRRGRR